MIANVHIRAWPRHPVTGVETPVRFGGGPKALVDGHGHYAAGVAERPLFKAALGFSGDGWTGGSIPTASSIAFHPTKAGIKDTYLGLVWPGARIELDRVSGGVSTRLLTGAVADLSWRDGAFQISFADNAERWNQAILGSFAGTGGVEGYAGATGRPKRRSWGVVRNVEGRLLDPVNNIYEFGDPAFPFKAFTTLRDKGREGARVEVAWQGSVAATLAALSASTPAQGGGVVAPSIACAKWWTQPAGPLTADVKGENSAGYVATAPEIAARLMIHAGGVGPSNLAAAIGWRSETAGLHVADASETWSTAIDRILLGVSLLWIALPDGDVRIGRWSFDGPVASLNARFIARERAFAPTAKRTVRHKINHRVHGDGEISAALLATDATYIDGTLVETLKPAQPGATNDADRRTANVLTIDEKIRVVIDRENARSGVNGRYPTVRARMVALGLSVAALDQASVDWLVYRNGITGWNDTAVQTTIVRSTWDALSLAFDQQLHLAEAAIGAEDARRTALLQRGNSDLHNPNADFAEGVVAPFIGYSTQTLAIMPKADGSGYVCRVTVAANVAGGLYLPPYSVALPRGYRKVVVEFIAQSTLQASDWVLRLDQTGAGIVCNAALSTLIPIGEAAPLAFLTSGRLYRYEILVFIGTATSDVTLSFFCFGSYGGIVDVCPLGWGPASLTESDFSTLRPAEPGATAGAVLGSNLFNSIGGAIIPPPQILNSSLMLNADGTASYNSGSGPVNIGAVTLPGLGFSGDYDATFGATVDANGVLQGSGGKEVDNNLILTLQSPAGKAFAANNNGALDANQLPATFPFKLFRGGANVSSSATWAVTDQPGINGGTVTITNGVASIPTGCTIAKSAAIAVTGTLGGVVRHGVVTLSRIDAPPPQNGGSGSGTTGNDDALDPVTGTAMVAISNEIEFSTGANGTATFTGALMINAAAAANAGTFGARLRWRIKPSGGSYADVGALVSETQAAIVVNEGGGIFTADPGEISAALSHSGLTANAVHFAQLFGGRDAATPAKSVGFGGGVSVTGG